MGEDIFKIVRFDSDLANEQHIVMRAWDEFDTYIDDMIAERRSRLTDDLISELIRAQDDGDRLSNAEMRMLAFSILSAGTDTTRNQLAACMHALCDHPDQLAMLRDNPDLAMRAVEECMRHSPAVCTTLRTVLDDVTFAGYTFPAGTFISVNTFAANCDPEVYPHPDRFDITRDGPAAHFDVRRRRALLPRRQPCPNGARRSAQSPCPADDQPAPRGDGTVETDAGAERAGRAGDGIRLAQLVVRGELQHVNLARRAVDLDEGARRQGPGSPLDVHHTGEAEFAGHHRGV